MTHLFDFLCYLIQNPPFSLGKRIFILVRPCFTSSSIRSPYLCLAVLGHWAALLTSSVEQTRMCDRTRPYFMKLVKLQNQ